MKFLANENFPGPVVRVLREMGHDVAWIAEDMRAASDVQVLRRAESESRILLTFDRDFGELAFRRGLPATCGIVLLRLSGSQPEEDNARAVSALTSREDWAASFAVIHNDRIRIRPLPGVQ